MPGLPGNYLWQTEEQAFAYAAPLTEDIWIVECSGLPLELGGPFSSFPGERWTPDPISPDRLIGRVDAIPVAA